MLFRVDLMLHQLQVMLHRVPVGVDSVSYLITPKRGEVLGMPSNIFTVQFGSVVGGGNVSITTTESAPMKMAA